MMRVPPIAAIALVTGLAGSAWLHAQGPPPGTPALPAAPATPAPAVPQVAPPRSGPRTSLDVQVVLIRTQAGKVLSRLPYSLTVTTGAAEAVVNMGAEVPIPSTTFTPGRPTTPPRPTGGQPAAGAAPGPPAGPPAVQPPDQSSVGSPLQSFTYRNVGTVISCRAFTSDEGQFELTLSVDDSSVLPRDNSSQGGTLTAKCAPGRGCRFRIWLPGPRPYPFTGSSASS